MRTTTPTSGFQKMASAGISLSALSGFQKALPRGVSEMNGGLIQCHTAGSNMTTIESSESSSRRFLYPFLPAVLFE